MDCDKDWISNHQGGNMQIQVNTDNNIEGREALASYVEGLLEKSLDRFSDQITRIEVHLSDENSHKSGPDDKRCLIEACLKGRNPTSVSHQAASLDQAVKGAADKIKKSIESTLERLQDY
jgi:ribosomal subunit interface protein